MKHTPLNRNHHAARWAITLGAWLAGLAGSLAEVPRPEHPRPDLYRANWMTLNGEWM